MGVGRVHHGYLDRIQGLICPWLSDLAQQIEEKKEKTKYRKKEIVDKGTFIGIAVFSSK